MKASNAFPAVATGGWNIIHCKHQQNPENNSPVKSWLLWPRKYLRHWRDSKVVRKTRNPLPSSWVAGYLKSNNFSSLVNLRQPRSYVGETLSPVLLRRFILNLKEEISLSKSKCRDILQPRFILSGSKSSILQIKHIQWLNPTLAWLKLQPFAFLAPHKHCTISCNISSQMQKRQTFLIVLNPSNLYFAWRVVTGACILC